MSIRFLPAVLLPSEDKVVSALDGACWWAVKVCVGAFFNSHIHTHNLCLQHAMPCLSCLLLAQQDDKTIRRYLLSSAAACIPAFCLDVIGSYLKLFS